jgi:Mg/Co/Ni transporter MgtE
MSPVRRPRWDAAARRVAGAAPPDRNATPLATDAELAQLCDSGLPDTDLCDVSMVKPKPRASAVDEAWSRGKWLLGLLAVQSTSSFVLDAYSDLLRDHLSVTLFLVRVLGSGGERDVFFFFVLPPKPTPHTTLPQTMLVGAGGNAGNQSAIAVIRGLATGTIRDASAQSMKPVLARQAAVGGLLAAGLAAAGYVRVLASTGSPADAAAISVSLAAIVFSSVIVGAGLPFGLARVGVDPANAGTSVQVVMDIMGCAITCACCQLMLVQLAGVVGGGTAVAAAAGG